MPWISRRELSRLLRQIKTAELRAERAESQLATERERKDELVVQLASRVITRHGGYGLDEGTRETSPPAPPPHPRGFIREPTARDYDELEWLKQDAVLKGHTVEEAEQYWEAKMRGEAPMVVEEGGDQ